MSTTEHLSSTGGQDGGRHQRRLRLLVVCVGNHIRSPIAAAALAAQGGDDVVVRSAGLRYRHVGKGPHSNAVRAAAEHGYDIEDHIAVKVNFRLLEWADTILAMDHTVLDELPATADEQTTPKLHLYLDGEDVHDPWEDAYTAFQDCVAVIERGAARHLP
ncbi:low molecular weight phosphotyrosine protein phosphatase [Streptomyces griseorubiginosus]|uniref:arsenate reductase/protein-tyrosine-phosphatase family protein n=1 Tax=Streptomyces griseorubiginosus TaxID=67304 RepID=UPI00200F00BB|nr:low molecular weight phosphotyrosine protein phosphatase [Streptomyces griseorubiginosus]